MCNRTTMVVQRHPSERRLAAGIRCLLSHLNAVDERRQELTIFDRSRHRTCHLSKTHKKPVTPEIVDKIMKNVVVKHYNGHNNKYATNIKKL